MQERLLSSLTDLSISHEGISKGKPCDLKNSHTLLVLVLDSLTVFGLDIYHIKILCSVS